MLHGVCAARCSQRLSVRSYIADAVSDSINFSVAGSADASSTCVASAQHKQLSPLQQSQQDLLGTLRKSAVVDVTAVATGTAAGTIQHHCEIP